MYLSKKYVRIYILSKKKRGEIPLKIYNLFPIIAGPIPNWKFKLKDILYMGFDHIYINPIFATGYSKNLYAPKNFVDFSEQVIDIFSEKSGIEQFEEFIEEAHKLGIKIIFEVIFTHTSIDSDLLIEHPEWYSYEKNGKIKKFSIKNYTTWIEWGDLIEINNHCEDEIIRMELWTYWGNLIFSIIDKGVDIIKLHSSFNLPIKFVKQLITNTKSKYPHVKFIGDNLGANFSDMLDLASAGVDYLFTSFKWWDFKATWFLEQHYKLKEFVKLISFPENYDTERLAQKYNCNISALKIWYAISALINSGVMIPIGFEHGSKTKINDLNSFSYEDDNNLDLKDYIKIINKIKNNFKIFNEENDIYIINQENYNIFEIKKVSLSKEEFVLIIANLNFENEETTYISDIFSMLENNYIIDISPYNKIENFYKNLQITLKAGEIKIFYTKK